MDYDEDFWQNLDLRQPLVQLPPGPFPRPCRVRNNLWAFDHGQQSDLSGEGGLRVDTFGNPIVSVPGAGMTGSALGSISALSDNHPYRAFAIINHWASGDAAGSLLFSPDRSSDNNTIWIRPRYSSANRVDGGVTTNLITDMAFRAGSLIVIHYWRQKLLRIYQDGQLIGESTDLPNGYNGLIYYNAGATPKRGPIVQRL